MAKNIFVIYICHFNYLILILLLILLKNIKYKNKLILSFIHLLRHFHCVYNVVYILFLSQLILVLCLLYHTLFLLIYDVFFNFSFSLFLNAFISLKLCFLNSYGFSLCFAIYCLLCLLKFSLFYSFIILFPYFLYSSFYCSGRVAMYILLS